MRYKILLYGLMAAVITSCSSAYKASQTPDDVYFSPAKEGVKKETVKKERDRYEDYVSSEDDQYLRMKIRDRERWSGIDDYAYWNDSRYVPSYNYNYNYDFYRNNIYNTYAWNNWYSPYSSLYYNPSMFGGYGSGFGSGVYLSSGYYPRNGYGYNSYGGGGYISKNPVRVASPSAGRPNLGGYRNGLYNNSNSNNNNANAGFGNTMKRVFAPNQNSNARTYDNSNSSNTNTNTYNAPQRTYTPSSSSSSTGSTSSSSGSSSGGGVSRPPR